MASIVHRNPEWGALVRERRQARRMTRRAMANHVGIDPSYVTLIERDGYVPKRAVVIGIANALLADVDRVLVVAGYAPVGVPAREVLERVDGYKAKSVDDSLKPLLEDLFALSRAQQAKVAEMLRAYMSTLRGAN